MIKAMIFIDGTWLYSNTPRLAEQYGRSDYHLDFGKLPQVLASAVSRQLGGMEVDVVRTHLFGSYAANYDPRDDDAVQRRLDFFALLREEYHYEVEAFPVNFKGRRLRKVDRDPRDTFEPREKSVDISLATSMLFNAAMPGAFDIAIAVLGDHDFRPLLRAVRQLGKRVALASIQGSCAPDFADPGDPDRIRDFDMIWLSERLADLELKYTEHQRECEAPGHLGERFVWTTFHPRKGQRFYCDACRDQFHRERTETADAFPQDDEDIEWHSGNGHLAAGPIVTMTGEVKKKVADRGFGFIQAEDGFDYFFHLSDLEPGIDFMEVIEGLAVAFDVKRRPSPTKAGAAMRVRRQPRPLHPA